MVMSANRLVLLIVLQVNVFKEQGIVLVNASLDSMVIIATCLVQQTATLLCVIRLLVNVVEVVKLVSMAINAHKYVQTTVKTLVIEKRDFVVPVKWGTMEKNVEIYAMKIVRMVVIM